MNWIQEYARRSVQKVGVIVSFEMKIIINLMTQEL